MKNIEFSVKINGDNWRVFLVSGEEFQEAYAERYAAVTISEKRCMIFQPGYLQKHYIVHECVHAYASYLCTESADLSAQQMEEVMCDMLGMRIEQIRKTSKEIELGLRRLRRSIGVA